MDEIISTRYTDTDRERECCQQLLEIATRENDTYGLAFANTYLGDFYIAQNDTTNCGYHLLKARLLCEENSYFDLLIWVFNLFGICYEALSDEQTAVQYYLRALQLGQEIRNTSIESVLLNNIACDFANLKDFAESKKYYSRACESLQEHGSSLPNTEYIQLRLWGNISEVCRHLDELEEMREHLKRCEEISGKFSQARDLILYRGWCGYHAKRGEREKSVEIAEKLILYIKSHDCQDKYFVYEVLIDVCEIMIDLSEKESAGRFLEHILTMRQDGEVDRGRQIQKLNTRYCEVFGTGEELNEAYREYYQLMTSFERNIYGSKTNGIKNIIYLDHLKNTLTLEKQSLDHEAHLDELTKLCNRRYFNKLINKVGIDPDTKSVGLIMIDIDYFKEYNDAYGHTKGDSAIVAVAGCLAGKAPKDIYVSRYGGDEFVCLCVNTDKNGIVKYIKAVRRAVATLGILHEASRGSSRLTVSIGFSHRNWSTGLLFSGILDEADQALYAAKAAGRNTYRGWEDIKGQSGGTGLL